MSRRTTGSRVTLALITTSTLVGAALVGSSVPGASATPAARSSHARRPIAPDLSAGHMTPAVYGAPRALVGAVPSGVQAHTSPAVTFNCQTTTPQQCYSPSDIRHVYGIDGVSGDGTGQTIAIVDAFSPPNVQADLESFDQTFGLPAADLTIVAPNGSTAWDPNDTNQVGWSGEIALDVEWAHAVAPGAKILLVEAKTNDDKNILKAERYVIRRTDADVLTQSYGENEACQDPTVTKRAHGLYRQAAANGMSVFASSGDQGAGIPNCAGTDYVKEVGVPAVDPYVTAVGGTLLTASQGTYQSETTWNEPSYESAGGGGVSTLFATPAYQQGVNTGAKRTIPDVAYTAGIDTGVLTVWSNSGYGSNLVFRFGGTSAGSPQWAAMTALADQQAGHGIGLLNPQAQNLVPALAGSTPTQ